MSAAGNMTVLSNPVTKVLDNTSSFPVSAKNGIGAVAYNTDDTAPLIVDFTLLNDEVITITIPKNTGWYDFLPIYKTVAINAGSTSAAFVLHLKEFIDTATAGGGIG